MKVELIDSRREKIITPSELQTGQVAVVIQAPSIDDGHYIGTIVIRHQRLIIPLGIAYQCWYSSEMHPDWRFRLLEPGEKLVIK